MSDNWPLEGVVEKLVPNVRTLSIEANDIQHPVPGRAVDTLNIWSSTSVPILPNASTSIMRNLQTLSGTMAVVTQLLSSGVEDLRANLTELVIFFDAPIYPISQPVESLLSIAKLVHLRCLALIIQTRQNLEQSLVRDHVHNLYVLASSISR
ncbi:hypothetical protein B0H14DRAFT_3441758 [Mycena olivaceomarginata]|nr:hypothetical protein B0H14DRAFT_3441758 [Mycena olivaceomarginata]